MEAEIGSKKEREEGTQRNGRIEAGKAERVEKNGKDEREK